MERQNRSFVPLVAKSAWAVFCVLAASWSTAPAAEIVSSIDVDRTTSRAPIDLSLLEQVERRVLPPCLVQGPARFPDLPSYYWSENASLKRRFEDARKFYETGSPRPYRVLTLVAGSAGVGKTFIKGEVFSKDDPKDAVFKFDIKELYHEWAESGSVEDRPDLFAENVILSTLPALANGNESALHDYLASQAASFYVIDSLDEIHPDDYLPVLEQVERFVFRSDRPFVHVVVFGRPSAFRDYWDKNAGKRSGECLDLFMLQPPRFKTTGDLLVSTWNYHTWKYSLKWAKSGSQFEPMPLDVYTKWLAGGFASEGAFHSVHHLPNKNMRPQVQSTLESWATRHPAVIPMLYNLAGNSMLREIAERFALEEVPYDERTVMEAYLAKWLERQKETHNRPGFAELAHLDLNVELLERVAVKYVVENRVDSAGFFDVRDDDSVTVSYHGRQLSFPVRRVLDRSGLNYFDPRDTVAHRYRFEPIWFHRLLVERHNDRSCFAMQRTAAFFTILTGRRTQSELPRPAPVKASQ